MICQGYKHEPIRIITVARDHATGLCPVCWTVQTVRSGVLCSHEYLIPTGDGNSPRSWKVR